MSAPRLTEGLVILPMTDDEFIAYLNQPQEDTAKDDERRFVGMWESYPCMLDDECWDNK
jgi:hypothetical protein